MENDAGTSAGKTSPWRFLVGMLVAIGAIGTYIWQQSESRYHAEGIAREGRAARLAGQKLGTFMQACKAASTLALLSKPSHPEYTEQRLRLEQLYFGEMRVIQSVDIETKFITFRRALIAMEQNPESKDQRKLLELALDLAESCRIYTGVMSGVPFAQLDDSLEHLEPDNLPPRS